MRRFCKITLGYKLLTCSLCASFLCLGLLGCRSTPPVWATRNNPSYKPKLPSTSSSGVSLELVNTTGEIVAFEISGLTWEKGTPVPFTATLGTDQTSTYDYGKRILVDYPIFVSWRGLATGTLQAWGITGIGGAGDNEKVLKEGILVIGLSPAYELNSFFLRGKNHTKEEVMKIARQGHR